MSGRSGPSRPEGGEPQAPHARGKDAPASATARPGASAHADLQLAHDMESIRQAEQQLLDAVVRASFDEASAFAIRLALEEALYNAFRHGHKNLPHERVRLEWTVDPSEVRITVTDKGPGFNPEGLPDPTSEERIELPHGRGVMLMRAYMSSVEFDSPGNRVRMVYRKPEGA